MGLSWPWRVIISLSDEEKLRRRELLDLRGSYAQWSVIVIIVTLRIYRSWIVASGPVDGTSKSGRGLTSWWDRPLFAGWLETRRQYLTCGLWLLWLLSLSMWNTGGGIYSFFFSLSHISSSSGFLHDYTEYLHLTKALGHVALSQIPLQVLMSPAAYISSSNPSASSVFSFLTSVPQTTVTPFHRVFGRVVISPLLLGHATLYVQMFMQFSYPGYSSLFSKRVRDSDVQLGLIAVTALISLLLYVRPRAARRKGEARAQLSAETIRRRRLYFYIGHVSIVVILCTAAYFHVAQAQKYMAQTLGAFVLNGLCSLAMLR